MLHKTYLYTANIVVTFKDGRTDTASIQSLCRFEIFKKGIDKFFEMHPLQTGDFEKMEITNLKTILMEEKKKPEGE